MNAFKLTFAALAVAFGSGAAHADTKVPSQYPISTERSSVDQVGAGRLVESRTRTDQVRTATRRAAPSGQGLALNDSAYGGRDTIFGN